MVNQRGGIWKVAIFAAFFAILFLGNMARAATNISPTDHWAWNDIVGWIDFYNTNTVTVASQSLSGYAASSVGDISLDCHTTSSGDRCAQSNYQVVNNGNGLLSGWGWNDLYGWISFCGGQNTSTCPGNVSYEARIDPTTGDFSDYAWNDAVGWISFCGVASGGGGCVTTSFPYKVNTSWRATPKTTSLDSSTFDTGVAGGANLNSVIWQGTLAAGAEVRFKFAGSNSASGPWNFLGPDGTTADADFYGNHGLVLPDTSYPLSYSLHNNFRYFRYRVILVSDQAQQATPRIDDIIVSWSP